jgi:hypothetical protein
VRGRSRGNLVALVVHLHEERRDLLPLLVRLGSKMPIQTSRRRCPHAQETPSQPIDVLLAPYHQRLQRRRQQRDTVTKIRDEKLLVLRHLRNYNSLLLRKD